jgi:uncharacterized sodium:solute symporter family permease YidK
MGYGFGAFLVALGLILALAVSDSVEGVDLVMIGWILTAVGIAVILLSAVTLNRRSGIRSVATTQHPDGSQTVDERRTDIG